MFGSQYSEKDAALSLFSGFKEKVLGIDPVIFCEKNLTLDGAPFRLTGNGYKPFADIYRNIALRAVEPGGKPIVLVKGRQVGATTMAGALEMYFMACGLYGVNGRAPMRIMHLFPSLTLAGAYSKDKLNSLITTSVPVPGLIKKNGMLKSFLESRIDTSTPANNSMFFKKFLGGNQVWIESTGLDGDRIRGRTVDLILADEVQDLSRDAIGTTIKSLSQSKYGSPGDGVQAYFGTPKAKGGAYWEMWQKSTQQYFHLSCEKCGDYFPLYRPDVNWEEIWLHGFIVKCTHCSHEQDKRVAAENGKWIAQREDEDSAMYGYHFNQLLIPHFPKETILKQKPEEHPTNSEKLYMNEVLGEFFDGEGGTITMQELRDACGDANLAMVSSVTSTEKRVYAGFDWGQKSALDALSGKKQQGKSYSCCVIICADGPQLFSIKFATRLTKNDPNYKREVVDEMLRKYRVNLAVGDIGDAFDLSHDCQKKYGDRFLVSRLVPKVIGHIKFDREIFPKEIKAERDYYISELIGLLKNGQIKFPFKGKSYELIDWLVRHCTSMEIKITRNKSGDPIKHYVKGSTPNDGFMALLNAYLAWKWDVTQGFSIRQPQQMKYDTAVNNNSVQAVLGYMPKVSAF